jgi:very-short-patch-repair endonuclease/transposase
MSFKLKSGVPKIKKIKWPTEQEYNKLYIDEKKTLTEIAAMFDVCYASIRNYAHRKGWLVRSAQETASSKYTWPTEEEYNKLYFSEGMTLSSIANKYGLTDSMMKSYAKRKGWKVRSPKDSRKRNRDIVAKLSREALEDLTRKGMTASEMAGVFDVSSNTVGTNLNRLGIPRNAKSTYGYFHRTLVEAFRSNNIAVDDSQINFYVKSCSSRIDIAFPNALLGVEVDESGHTDKQHKLFDIHRDTLLECEGWNMLRFSIKDIIEKLDDIIVLVKARLGRKQQENSASQAIA